MSEEEEISAIDHLLSKCGFDNESDREKVRDRLGFKSLGEFSMLREKHITNVANSLSKSSKAADRVIMTTKQIMYLQSACDWIRDSKRRGVSPIVEELTTDIIIQFIETKQFDEDRDKSEILIPPKSFEPSKWVQ